MESNEDITIHRMLYVNITWKIDDNRDANQIKTKQPAFHVVFQRCFDPGWGSWGVNNNGKQMAKWTLAYCLLAGLVARFQFVC